LKKAFTMIELVFVIVIIGILAAVIIPNTKTNPLQEAAMQVLSHIRYTQHLAMTDDRYDPNNRDSAGAVKWFKERWQIVFHNTVAPDNDVAYTIFSDTSGDSTGDASLTEIAINPQDDSKLLSGGYGATILSTHPQMTKKLNLEKSYGITSVTFGVACNRNGGTRLSFDHLGRPFQGRQSSMTSPYNVSTPYAATQQRLITADCTVTLSDGTDNVVLRISPETGYSCILDATNNCI
jgi:prepilin-type N-terminal cleavage/methylation domain-containing protein